MGLLYGAHIGVEKLKGSFYVQISHKVEENDHVC